jgi:hypothetical protein
MPMNPVVTSLRMQFEAGPQTMVFYACHDHRLYLAQARVSCFFRLPAEYLQKAEPDDGSCYFCRGEEGPDR